MKKPLICASLACACAFALQAGTNTWFTGIGSSASASDYDSLNGTWDTNTYVQAGGEVTWDGTAKKFSFDLEDSEYITFNTTSGTSPDTNTVTRVEVKGAFTPVSSDLPTTVQMNERLAQVGFVVSTNGLGSYVYKAWYGNDGWVALTNDSVTPDGSENDTDLIVEFDYSGRDDVNKNYVSFYIKSSDTEYALANSSSVTKFEMTSIAGAASNQVAGVSCYGSGTIAQADGAVEIGIATLNGKKYPSIGAAVAAASGTAEISVVRPTDEAVTVNKAGITINDPNDIYTGNVAVDGVTTTVKPAAVEFTGVELAGKSGTYTLKAGATAGNIDSINVELPMSNKEVASKTVSDGKVQVTIQTKTEILSAANPGGNKALSANVAKLRQFIAADTALNAADVAANVSTESITTALQANGGNGIPKWESYVLGIAPTASIKPVAAPAGDKSTTAITLAIPAINTANYSGDYTVKYKVGDGEEQDNPAAIQVPLTTGANTVKAVLKP